MSTSPPSIFPIPLLVFTQCTSKQVGPDLNYDEVTVYEEQAALPTYLIVYSSEFFDS